jgi:hypothetical protein
MGRFYNSRGMSVNILTAVSMRRLVNTPLNKVTTI